MIKNNNNGKIILPNLHLGQIKAYKAHLKERLLVLRCGRRWGKTEFLKILACNQSIRGRKIGYFAPAHKYMIKVYKEIKWILRDVIESSNQTEGIIYLKGGGEIETWSLDNEDAGRSRRYHGVLIDEASLCKGEKIFTTWKQAIMPTLLDYGGFAVVAGTPKGVREEDFYYEICTDKSYGFHEIYAPTSDNPMITKEGLEFYRQQNHPLVFQQEFLAEFVRWGGAKFFDEEKLLIDGCAIAMPTKCDYVFAVLDTATKTGKEHDGTAVVFCAFTRNGALAPLVFLDYDLVQIEGDSLNSWLPTVFEKLSYYAELCDARTGSAGAFIEDKSSGMMLLQHARKKGWRAHAIDSKLTALGKDERCISVSGYVWKEKVKLTQNIYDKNTTFKEKKRNHFLTQLLGYQLGDKDAATRADDLLDAAVYAIAISLGNSRGI